MDQHDLQETLAAHAKWLRAEPGGKLANLEDADLSYANLEDADLSYANLDHANLDHANLAEPHLAGANLAGANLAVANLVSADLRGANLWSADLHDANLEDADLAGANLRHADLEDANLGELRIVQIGPIGSRRDYLIVRWGKDHEGQPVDLVRTGCFEGTLSEFRAAVAETHGKNAYGRAYHAAIALIDSLREETNAGD